MAEFKTVDDIRVMYNLHGHLHSKKIDDSGYFNCSVEQHGLSPVNLDVIRAYFHGIYL